MEATLVAVVAVALFFDFTNGFHDTANSIATTVSTRAMSPRAAVLMAAVLNVAGAFVSFEVAATIAKDIVDQEAITLSIVLAGLVGAITWNLITWFYGLPSSSSHALIGGLCGAAIGTANGDWSVLKWSTGLWPKVVLPMFTSPLIGFVLGGALMIFLMVVLRGFAPRVVNSFFGKAQLVSAAWMANSHGTNDAQKTMGIITLALVTATGAGSFDTLPPWLAFLHTPTFGAVPIWVKVLCAFTMAAGTAAGGWRIIRTLGHKMVKLQPVHGFAAETTAALIIQVASSWGIPLSTTHVISTSIMGVGAAKRFSGVKWGVVERIVWAWVFTLPATFLLSYLLVRVERLFQ